MDDENYRDLVLKAWELSNAVEAMQKMLNNTFFNELIELDRLALEKRLVHTATEPPF